MQDMNNPTIHDLMSRDANTGFSPIIKQSDGVPKVIGYENLKTNRKFFL